MVVSLIATRIISGLAGGSGRGRAICSLSCTSRGTRGSLILLLLVQAKSCLDTLYYARLLGATTTARLFRHVVFLSFLDKK